MVSNVWEEDALFLVFEEDFRFEPEAADAEPAFIRGSCLQEIAGVHSARSIGAVAGPSDMTRQDTSR